MDQEIKKLIIEALANLNLPVPEKFSVELTENLEHGDFASNVAMILAKEVKQSPLELAQKISKEIVRPDWLAKVEAVAPGFINFYLAESFLKQELENINKNIAPKSSAQKALVEYTDPNPFKEFHIGHLMSNTIGEALSRLIEWNGAEVKRANYQGDVGLHVAKALWGKLKNPELAWGKAYAVGAQAYEVQETAKQEIIEINKKVYEKSDPEINKLYEEGKKESLVAFESMYAQLGTKFDFYFFESEMADPGKKIVEEYLANDVFEQSDGAIVFVAEKYNPELHTRVYLTSQGLPTYETKELGLHFAKNRAYPADLSVVITANEQAGVFAVGLEALKQIDASLATKVKHITHGLMLGPDGRKMSSRTGEVISAESLLDELKKVTLARLAERDFDEGEKLVIAHAVAVGALKYLILKQSPGKDIIFNLERALSLEGDSGPYLQYALVRARAVLERAKQEGVSASLENRPDDTETLERLLHRFVAVATRASERYAPNLLVTYLTELASTFNAYYAGQKIIDPTDPHSSYRLALTAAVAQTLTTGLTLLAIPTPERM